MSQSQSDLEDQFDLEDQGEGHQVSNSRETFMWSIYGSSLKVKFQMIQKLYCSQGIKASSHIDDTTRHDSMRHDPFFRFPYN